MNASRRRSASGAHARQLAALRRLAIEISALRDIDTLSDRVLRIVREAMGGEDGFLLTLNDEGSELVVRAASGPKERYLGERLPRGRGISWDVIESGKPRNVPDVRRVPSFYGPRRIRSSLFAPLALGDERIGVIGVESARVGAFGREDEELLSAVSHHVAAAIRVAKLHQEAKTAAGTDPLTGLANRRVFFDRLEAEVARARRLETPLAVAIVDVDGLKATNDTYGHRVGDIALQRIASILAQGVRGADLAARYGGDEFALLFPGAAILEAERVMRRLEQRVRDDGERTVPGGLPSIAWGVAALPAGAANADALIDAADKAMYRRKSGPKATRLA